MRLVVLAILLAVVLVDSTRSEDTRISGPAGSPAPVKIDKNLRRALLKALADLEAESAERQGEEDESVKSRRTLEDISKKDLNKDLGIHSQRTTFSFDGFPGEEETPSEDKLQNSSFVVTEKFSPTPSMTIEKAGREDARSFHVQNVIVPRKNSQEETKNAKVTTTSVKKVESVTLKPSSSVSGSLLPTRNDFTSTLVTPKPTASTISSKINETLSASKEKSEEVKIFQAPLVAAFTVQQDELGVPKSVVPIYKSSGDQALTLQEQLEFKQRLLEKQLAELQQQQIRQTQFLMRQRQLYEQQLRQKQQQQLYFQEQARLKQLEEERQKRLEEQRLKRLEEQRIYRFQQQKPFFERNNNQPFQQQPPFEANVHFQPSVSLEVPSAAAPLPFQTNFQDQFRLNQFRSQPQPQQQQQQQQQQRLQQQNFGPFPTDFQPPITPATRFHRQEAFNSVGNFGLNSDNKSVSTRYFGFPERNLNFYYPQDSFGQARPQTPAKQIQRLLYQSGIAGEIGGAQGSSGQEDLNILSKVLALNVGAVPNKNFRYNSAVKGNA